MASRKSELLEAAIALNGNDKKYEITVDGDEIITRVKWMDAEFFSPYSITDEVKEFSYIVKVNDNGTYTELDRSMSTQKSAKRGAFSYQKNLFVGKQISFDKTVGFGRNNETGKTGLVSATFNSEEYKAPVRTLLKENGYKKKMGVLGKTLIGTSIVVVIFLIVAIILLNNVNSKEPISVSDFESISKSFGYQIGVDKETENKYDYIKNIRIAIDTKDNYQIEFYVLSDDEYAKAFFENNKADFYKKVSEENGIYTDANSKNYNNFSASTDTSYLYASRIANTVLYIDADIGNKEKVKKFIKEINY